MSCGPSVGQHQARIENARIGRSARAHAGKRRFDDLAHDTGLQLGRQHSGGRIGAHAAGVRTLVAVEDALVVLRRAEGEGGGAVAQGEEARLLAFEKGLDHDLGAGLPRPPPSIMSMASSASSTVVATTTPLPAASPSAFTTMGTP